MAERIPVKINVEPTTSDRNGKVYDFDSEVAFDPSFYPQNSGETDDEYKNRIKEMKKEARRSITKENEERIRQETDRLMRQTKTITVNESEKGGLKRSVKRDVPVYSNRNSARAAAVRSLRKLDTNLKENNLDNQDREAFEEWIENNPDYHATDVEPPVSTEPEASESAPERVEDQSPDQAPPESVDNNENQPVVPLTVGFADVTRSARAEANMQGQEENDRHINRTRGIRGFFNRIIRGSAFKEFYDIHYADQAMVEMRENGGVGRNLEEIERNNAAILERTVAEAEEFIRENEDRAFLNENDPRTISLRNLLGRYASGQIDRDAYEAERDALQAEILDEEHSRDELFGINNLDQVADAVRLAVENGQDLNEVLAGFRVARMTNAHVGANTEARLGRVDRIVDTVMKSRVGRFLPSIAVGLGVNIALNAVVPAAKWGLVGAGVVVTGGAVGLAAGATVAGGMAFAKERIRSTDDRNRFIRDNASGRGRPSLPEQETMFTEWLNNGIDRDGRPFGQAEYDASITNARRVDRAHQRLMETQYEMRNVFDLQDSLATQLDILGENPSLEQIQESIAMLGAVNWRIYEGDSGNRDLIDFTGAESIDEEWNRLSLLRSQILERLEDVTTLNDDNAEIIRQLFGDNANLNSLINDASEAERVTIQADIDLKDAAAIRQRRSASIRAGLKTAGISVGLGFVAQEVVGFINSDRTNLMEEIYARATGDPEAVNGSMRTAGAGVYDAITGQTDTIATLTHEPASTEMSVIGFGNGSSISLSSDLHIEGDPAVGAFSILDKNGDIVADGLTADPVSGQFSPESMEKIEGLGGVVEMGSWSTTEIVDANEASRQLIDQYKDHVINWSSRDVDYNPGDGGITQNELSGHIGDNGELWDSATPWGSWSDSGPADVTAPPENSVVMMLPASEVYPGGVPADVAVAPDGNIYLEFSYQEGFPPEVMQGIDHHPTVAGAKVSHWPGRIAFVEHAGNHIEQFASIPGDSNMVAEVVHNHTDTVIVGPGYDVELVEETPIQSEIPVIFPYESRRPLGDYAGMRHFNTIRIPNMYYVSGSLGQDREWIRQNPQILRTRKRVERSDGTIDWVEADGKPVERDVARERKVLQQYLNSERAKDTEYNALINKIVDALKPMENNNRVSINIPAYMEEDNIYNLLTQYSQQSDGSKGILDPRIYEINIIVNRPQGKAPDATVAEIERFINDNSTNPNAPRVNYVDVELSPENANVGYARKLVTDAVLQRSIDRSQTEPLYIESEDADHRRIDSQTVINLINNLDRRPWLDAIHGVEDRDPSIMKNNDYLFMRRRAWDFFVTLASQERFRDPTQPSWNYVWNRNITGGWNNGYSAEAYAMIGGYDSVKAGEDLLIGQKMTMMRGDGSFPNLEVVGRSHTRTDSSPRRFILEIIQNDAAYNGFGDEEKEKLVRQSLPELMNAISSHSRVNDANKGDFVNFLNGVHGWSQSATGGSEQAAKQMTKRILFFLGLKKTDYHFSGNNLVVDNLDNFSQSVEKYRNNWDAHKIARYGNVNW